MQKSIAQKSVDTGSCTQMVGHAKSTTLDFCIRIKKSLPLYRIVASSPASETGIGEGVRHVGDVSCDLTS